jgi:hypothetical protein
MAATIEMSHALIRGLRVRLWCAVHLAIHGRGVIPLARERGTCGLTDTSADRGGCKMARGQGRPLDWILVDSVRTASLLSFLVIGCTGEAAPDAGVASATRPAVVANVNGCFDPAQYGGSSDDELDDRVAIQSAIDAASESGGGRVCLGDGRWRVSRAPAGSYNRFAALTIHTPRIELIGNGPGTVIEVVGDQGAATISVIGIDPGAQNIAMRDFILDTSGMTNTSEQTHAIQIGSGIGVGPVEDVQLERVIFNHRLAPPSRKGDCLKLAGNTAPNQVRRVIVIGSTFPSCARSGIAIQRGVHDLVIMGNQFTQAGDQDIDSEPSAAGGNSGLTIVGNIFRDNVELTQADWAVTIGGYGEPINAVTLANNVFEGRGVNLYLSANTVISGNTFNTTMESGYGVINFGHRAETIVINGNTLRRRGVDGPMIRIVHTPGFWAQNVTISNNEMIQDTLGGGVVTESAVKMSVVNNGIEWTQPAPNALGVSLRATIVQAQATMISNNRMVGSIKYGISLAATPFAFNTTSVVGNMTTGATTSLRCEQSVPNNYKQPVVYAANNFNSPTLCVATLVPSRP